MSTATVSRALNSLSSVRPATRDKVLAAMEELKFVPNTVARGLSSGKHWILGLVFTRAVVDETGTVPDTGVLVVEEASLLYTDIVIRGAEMRAAEHGYSLLLSSADERHPSGITSLLNLTGTVDGLILLDRVLKDDDVDYLAKRIPIVMLAGRGDLASVVTVRVDNNQAMRSLAEHLIVTHGLTRLSFVTGANESPDSVARAT
ncbi:MAG: LacI family DNA-binding transcriptional regulator, partial [Acidimicrobiales bacterium]